MLQVTTRAVAPVMALRLRPLAARAPAMAMALRPSLVAPMPRALALRGMCSSSTGSGTKEEDAIRAAARAWQMAYMKAGAPPLRFPLGAPVECRVSAGKWARGTIAAHHHREPSFPPDAKVPYQILLDEADRPNPEQNAVWAPADVDECGACSRAPPSAHSHPHALASPHPARMRAVRAALRFKVGDAVECRIGATHWATGTIVAHFYREDSWPESQWAPYQVKLDEIDAEAADALSLASSGELVWSPADTDDVIRAVGRG